MLNHATQDKPAILITGAAKRVGRHLALSFAKLGYPIAFTYNQSETQAQSLLHELKSYNITATAIQADFKDESAPEHIFEQFRQSHDHLAALINNASCFYPTPLTELSATQLQDNFLINAQTPLLLAQRFAPLLAQAYDPKSPRSTGRIINFIDINTLGQTLPNHIAYNISKAALYEITKSLAIELAPQITVNAIAPGVIEFADSYTSSQQQNYLKRVPLNCVGSPEDAFNAAKYLIQDAHYTTGQVLRIDGGRSIT